VPLPGQAPVGRPDPLRGGVPGDVQDLVVELRRRLVPHYGPVELVRVSVLARGARRKERTAESERVREDSGGAATCQVAAINGPGEAEERSWRLCVDG
jgi:hypothetical protein